MKQVFLNFSLVFLSLSLHAMDRETANFTKKVAYACADCCCIVTGCVASCTLLVSLLEHPGYPNDHANCCTALALASTAGMGISTCYAAQRIKQDKEKIIKSNYYKKFK